MADDNIIENLLEELFRKTKEGKALWVLQSRNEEYALKFGNGTLVIDRWIAGGDQLYDLALLNTEKEKIYSYLAEPGDELYPEFCKLHDMITRRVQKIDETLESLLQKLRSDETIGDTDAPFSPF